MSDSDADIQRVHEYWFGTEPVPDMQARSKLWFNGGVEVDDYIRANFESLITAASQRQLDHWCETPKGAVTLIVVLDQFPLNVYRKTARAFAFESQAIEICQQGLSRQFDRALSLQERLFFYLPLSHSEDLGHQDQVVSLFEQMVAEAAPAEQEFAGRARDSALEHREQIREFGRYPYRNAVLGRESTDAELTWLAGSPSRYGQ